MKRSYLDPWAINELSACGSAAHQCGKALPYRVRCIRDLRGYASVMFLRRSLNRIQESIGKAEPYRTEVGRAVEVVLRESSQISIILAIGPTKKSA
jgi:hypothetical protein